MKFINNECNICNFVAIKGIQLMKVSSNKVSDVFSFYLSVLEDKYESSESKSFLYILFEHYFKFSKLDFVKEPDYRLSESELLKIHFSVKELLKNKPIQHIIGSVNFCGFVFKVSPDVLIPRPETEELVELIVEDCKDLDQKISILDIGTGSGCIAISLSKKIVDSHVQAIDVSEEALKVASENSKINQANAEFTKLDVLNESEIMTLPQFDIIVSNPPYIRNSEKSLMQKNVLDYDPEKALFVSDDNPLIFYKTIAELGLAHLNKNGRLYFEINEAFGSETSDLLKGLNYSTIKIYKDFRGKDRFVSAVYPKNK